MAILFPLDGQLRGDAAVSPVSDNTWHIVGA